MDLFRPHRTCTRACWDPYIATPCVEWVERLLSLSHLPHGSRQSYIWFLPNERTIHPTEGSLEVCPDSDRVTSTPLTVMSLTMYTMYAQVRVLHERTSRVQIARNEHTWSSDRAPKQAIKLNFGLGTSDRHAWVACSRGGRIAAEMKLGQLLRRRAPSVRPPHLAKTNLPAPMRVGRSHARALPVAHQIRRAQTQQQQKR